MRVTLPSPAERTLLVALAGLAATGGLLGFEALKGLQYMQEFVGRAAGEWVSTFAAALGGVGAPLILRHRFGLTGVKGTLAAFGAAFVATGLLGILAGTFVLPVFGTMFGPWLILTTVLEQPWLLAPWLLCLYAYHVAEKDYARESETLFRRVRQGLI